MKKTIVNLAVLATFTGALLVSAGVAMASPKLNLFGPNWDIMQSNLLPNGGYNYATSHPDTTTSGIVVNLPDVSEGYVHYLHTNYNLDLTGKTISADVQTTLGSGAAFDYHHYGGTVPANVRIEFQSANGGNSIANDYWWAHGTGAVNLANAQTGVTLTADTSDPSQWSNICGQSATDNTVYAGSDCIGGVYPGVSPHDGFLAALKNVKVVGFSFGGGSFFANGVGVTGSTGTFAVTNFSIN